MGTSLHLIHRSLRRYRRPLIALLVGIAVAAGVSAASRPAGSLATVLVSSRPLAGGALLTAQDVALVQWPVEALPASYLSDPAEAIGRIVTVPLPANTVVVDSAVVTARGLVAEGMTAVPVSVMATAAGLIRVGDRVDLYGLTQDEHATLLAARARVLAVVGQEGAGVLGATSSGDGVTLVVEVTASGAPALVAEASRGPLGFSLR